MNKWIIILALFVTACVDHIEPIQSKDDNEEIVLHFTAQAAMSHLEQGNWTKGENTAIQESYNTAPIHILGFMQGGLIFAKSFDNISAARFELAISWDSNIQFVLLGAMPFYNAQTGQLAQISEAIPNIDSWTINDYNNFVYKMDGGSTGLNSGYRRASLLGIDTCIPFVGSINQTISRSAIAADANGQFKKLLNFSACTRLFSRIDINIDPSGLIGSNYELLEEPKIRVYNNNLNINPSGLVSSKRKASSFASDTSLGSNTDVVGDSCSGLNNIVLYANENMQGLLLPSNSNSDNKSFSQLVSSAALSVDRARAVTYIEFSCRVRQKDGLFDGVLKYRFFPGSNNTTDFSLVRNTRYTVNLGFQSDNLYDSGMRPVWKLDVESLDYNSDMLFCFTADKQHNIVLSDGQDVVVRPGKSAKFYPYVNMQGEAGSNNELEVYVEDIHKNMLNFSHTTRINPVTGSCFQYDGIVNCDSKLSTSLYTLAGGMVVDLSDTYWAQSQGLLIEYVPTEGYIQISMHPSPIYQSNFMSNVSSQKSIAAKMILHPQVDPSSGDYPEFDFNIVFRNDVSVTPIGNYDCFVPGMKGSVHLNNFWGSVSYQNIGGNDNCFRYTIGDASRCISSHYEDNPAIPNSRIATRALHIYNYYCAVDEQNEVSTIRLLTDDCFNDGVYSNATGGYTNPRSFEFTITNESVRVVRPDYPLDFSASSQLAILNPIGDESSMRYYVTYGQDYNELLLSSECVPEVVEAIYTPMISYNIAPMKAISPINHYYEITPSSAQADIGLRYQLADDSGDYVAKLYFHRNCLGDRNNLADELNEQYIRQLYFMPSPDGKGYKQRLEEKFYYVGIGLSNLRAGLSFSNKKDYSINNIAAINNSSELIASGASNFKLNRIDWSSSCVQLFAKPNNANSLSYSSGQSESIKLSASNGSCKINFDNNSGSAKHSIGHHSVVLRLKNRWSNESVDYTLGSFSVNLVLLMGGYFKAYDTNSQGNYDVTVGISSYLPIPSNCGYLNSFPITDDILVKEVDDGGMPMYIVDQGGRSYHGHPNGFISYDPNNQLFRYGPDVIRTYTPSSLSEFSNSIGYGCLQTKNMYGTTVWYEDPGHSSFTATSNPRLYTNTVTNKMKTNGSYCAFFYYQSGNAYASSYAISNSWLTAAVYPYLQLERLIDVYPQSRGWYNNVTY